MEKGRRWTAAVGQQWRIISVQTHTQKGVRVAVCGGDTEILPAWAELLKGNGTGTYFEKL